MTHPRRATEILLVTAIVLVGLWLAAIRPAQQDAGRLDDELAVTRQQTAEASARVTALREARRRAPEHRRALRRLAVALPASGDVADLVRELDGAGDRSRVRLESVGLAAAAAAVPGVELPPGAAAEGPPPPGVPFELAFRGAYFDLTDLVDRVHATVRVAEDGVRARGRLVTVEAVTLTLDEDERGRGTVDAALDAVAHVAPEVTP